MLQWLLFDLRLRVIGLGYCGYVSGVKEHLCVLQDTRCDAVEISLAEM